MEYRRFKCKTCGKIYDEAVGDPKLNIAPGTRWEDLPDDWECPGCGACKAMFKEIK